MSKVSWAEYWKANNRGRKMKVIYGLIIVVIAASVGWFFLRPRSAKTPQLGEGGSPVTSYVMPEGVTKVTVVEKYSSGGGAGAPGNSSK